MSRTQKSALAGELDRTTTAAKSLAAAPAGPTYRQAEIVSMNRLNALDKTMAKIRSVEARPTDQYNSLVYGKPGFKTPTHADLTNMTISEVQAYQKGMKKAGHASTSVGAYQTTASTLNAAVKQLGIDPTTTKFSQPVQDQIARHLIEGRTRQSLNADGTVDQAKLERNLSKEWAGLATSTGKSFYHGVAGNAAGASYATTKGLASNLASTTPGTIATGFSAATPSYNDQSETPGQKAINSIAGAPSQSFRDKYLGGSPTQSAEPEAAKPKELTTGQKIAAGAIDIGVGLVPGIGPYLGLANAGLQALGNQSIGQQIVGGFGDGSGKGAAIGTPANGGTRNTVETKPEEKAAETAKAAAETTTVKTPERFVSTYLRPTPKEKWARA